MIYVESNEQEFFRIYGKISSAVKPRIYVGVLGGITQHFYLAKHAQTVILIDRNIVQIEYLYKYREGSCNFIRSFIDSLPPIEKIYTRVSDLAYTVCIKYGKRILSLLEKSIILHGDIFKIPIQMADLIYISNVLDYYLSTEVPHQINVALIIDRIFELLERSQIVVLTNMFSSSYLSYLNAALQLSDPYYVYRRCGSSCLYVVSKKPLRIKGLNSYH